MAPNGETLVMFSSTLGHKVYNKYIIQQKNNSQMVNKLRNIYNDYAELLAKGTEVWLSVTSSAVYPTVGSPPRPVI